MKYHLKGRVSIIQHCYEHYPKADLPILTRCPEPGACEGHTIMLDVTEIVKVDNQDEIIAASLKRFEGQGLEPMWEPVITELPLLVSLDRTMAQTIRDKGYICEIDPFGKVIYGEPPDWLPEEELYKYDFYLTNCPLEHGKDVDGLMMLGSMVFKAEDYPKVLEEARTRHQAYLARLTGE